MNVGLILLAAGGSTRLGQPKQLVPFRGKTLLRRAADTGLASKLRPVIAVLSDPRFAPEIAPAEWTLNPNWREGMGSSIQAGMSALGSRADAVVLMLCDQPLITPAFLDRLATSAAPLAAAEYNGTVGVPAFFSAEFFSELMRLKSGAKEILLRHRDRVQAFPCPEAAFDCDTAEDLARLTLAEKQQSPESQ